MESQDQVWNKLAGQWNNFRNQPIPIVDYFIKKFAKEKGKIIDLGCGNCRNLIPFKDFELYGIDFSKEMLDKAKKISKKYNLNIKLKEANLTKTPFKNNYFDYALMLASLHHLETKNKRDTAIEELYRILKENGLALITVWDKWQFKFLFKKKNSFIPWKVKDKTYYRYYYLFNYFELKKLLKKFNFTILESKRYHGNIMFIIKKISR